MPDIFTKEKRSEVMSRIKSKDTKPELLVRRFLFARGFRYRLHKKGLPGNPDLVFAQHKVIIFVHGCFWHAHCCKIGSGKRRPKSNVAYWQPKLLRTRQRDINNRNQLLEMGWKVIIVWECETYDEALMKRKLRPLLQVHG